MTSEYAAAFFLLGDRLLDAVNVCLKHVGDFQLAIAICRVYEGTTFYNMFLLKFFAIGAYNYFILRGKWPGVEGDSQQPCITFGR